MLLGSAGGALDGSELGMSLGTTLGMSLGDALGILLGAADGDAVGVLVGEQVGGGAGTGQLGPPGCFPPMTSKGPILSPTSKGSEHETWSLRSHVFPPHFKIHVLSMLNFPMLLPFFGSNMMTSPSLYDGPEGVCSTRSITPFLSSFTRSRGR